MKEYSFSVDVDDDQGQPFGPVSKENLDVARFVVDFTCWLDVGETVGQVDFVNVYTDPPHEVPPWQADYPLDDTSATQPPVDNYPLVIAEHTIGMDGRSVAFMACAGTPALSYVISFTAIGGLSVRRREVDILVKIDVPLNPLMVALAEPMLPLPTGPIFAYGTTVLPLGFTGRIYVQNTSNAPLTITLPPTPTLGDIVSPVDINLNADQYPITYKTAEGTTLYTSSLAGDDLRFEWVTDHWIILTNLFSFLA